MVLFFLVLKGLNLSSIISVRGGILGKCQILKHDMINMGERSFILKNKKLLELLELMITLVLKNGKKLKRS